MLASFTQAAAGHLATTSTQSIQDHPGRQRRFAHVLCKLLQTGSQDAACAGDQSAYAAESNRQQCRRFAGQGPAQAADMAGSPTQGGGPVGQTHPNRRWVQRSRAAPAASTRCLLGEHVFAAHKWPSCTQAARDAARQTRPCLPARPGHQPSHCRCPTRRASRRPSPTTRWCWERSPGSAQPDGWL